MRTPLFNDDVVKVKPSFDVTKNDFDTIVYVITTEEGIEEDTREEFMISLFREAFKSFYKSQFEYDTEQRRLFLRDGHIVRQNPFRNETFTTIEAADERVNTYIRNTIIPQERQALIEKKNKLVGEDEGGAGVQQQQQEQAEAVVAAEEMAAEVVGQQQQQAAVPAADVGVGSLAYQGFLPRFYFSKELQLKLLATSLNDFNHDFGHEKIIDYLKNVNRNLGNVTISSVEFEKKRLQFAMGAGGKTGAKIVKEISEAYTKVTGQKIKIDENIIPAQWKNIQTIADLGKLVDEKVNFPNIYKIYDGIQYKPEGLEDLEKLEYQQIGEDGKPHPLDNHFQNELTQITNVVGFKFMKLVNELNPEAPKPFPLNLSKDTIIGSLNDLELKIFQEFHPEAMMPIVDKAIAFSPVKIDEEEIKRKYYIHPVPVKILGRGVYLPGAIKRATGDNTKIVILIDASNLSMKSIGEDIAGLAANYDSDTPMEILILMNNANLADSAMKISKKLEQTVPEEKLRVYFATERVNSTTNYPRPDVLEAPANEIQNKALFNNFTKNTLTKVSAKVISADINCTDYTNIDDAGNYGTKQVRIDNLGEESEISNVSAKIVLDYLENNGTLSTESMVRSNTKKMGDSNQAISLLDLERTYHYCNIFGDPITKDGKAIPDGGDLDTFTLKSLKMEGWVIYLLTHDKVLLSIALLLGINVLYTLKLLFRFSEDIVKNIFGQIKGDDEEESTSRSITWLIGFQNALDITEFSEAIITKLIDEHVKKWTTKDSANKTEIDKLDDRIKAGIVMTLEAFRTYISQTYFNKEYKDVDKINLTNLLQVLYIFVDFLNQIPKLSRLAKLKKVIEDNESILLDITKSPVEKKEAGSKIESAGFELKNISSFLNVFAKSKEDFEAYVRLLIGRVLGSSGKKIATEELNVRYILNNFAKKEYEDSLKLSSPYSQWEEFKKKYTDLVLILQDDFKKLRENDSITPFQDAFFGTDETDDTFFIKSQVLKSAPMKSTSGRVIQKSPRDKLLELYNEIKETLKESTIRRLIDDGALIGGGVLIGGGPSQNLASKEIELEIYKIVAENSVTVIKDKGFFLDYYNYLNDLYYGKLEEYSNTSDFFILSDMNVISETMAQIYNLFNNPNNKPIYNQFTMVPLYYCMDSRGRKYELTNKFHAPNTDVYIEIPLLYPQISGKLGKLFTENKEVITKDQKLILLFEKLRLHYYETQLINYYEQQRSYLKFMLRQFIINNKNKLALSNFPSPKCVSNEDNYNIILTPTTPEHKFINSLKDDYLNIVDEIILNYELAFSKSAQIIKRIRKANELVKDLFGQNDDTSEMDKLLNPTEFNKIISIRNKFKTPTQSLVGDSDFVIEDKIRNCIDEIVDFNINKIRYISCAEGGLTSLSSKILEIKKVKNPTHYLPNYEKLFKLRLTKIVPTRNMNNPEVSLLLFDEYASRKIKYIQDILSATNDSLVATVQSAKNSKLAPDDYFDKIASIADAIQKGAQANNENSEAEVGISIRKKRRGHNQENEAKVESEANVESEAKVESEANVESEAKVESEAAVVSTTNSNFNGAALEGSNLNAVASNGSTFFYGSIGSPEKSDVEIITNNTEHIENTTNYVTIDKSGRELSAEKMLEGGNGGFFNNIASLETIYTGSQDQSLDGYPLTSTSTPAGSVASLSTLSTIIRSPQPKKLIGQQQTNVSRAITFTDVLSQQQQDSQGGGRYKQSRKRLGKRSKLQTRRKH